MASRSASRGRWRIAVPRPLAVKRIGLGTVALATLAVGLSEAPTVAQPAPTKLLRIPFPTYDGTLTPYTFKLGYPLVTLVYDTLLWRDAQGAPQPWLARSVERSDHGRRVTVRLRKGVRWQDGRPLTADDVTFTFRFVASRSPRTPELANVERVAATDAMTITFDLRRTSLGFDHQPLADLPILPRHLWQGLPAGQLAPSGLPVGSGPYRLVKAGAGTGYEFQANKAYFKGRPRVDHIQVPIIHDEQRTYAALQRRRLDMLPFSLPKQAADEVGKSFGINLRTGPDYSGTALLFNLRRRPFNSPAAREAVGHALDLERILRNAGPAVAADRGYIHPASPWAATTPLQRFDPQAAQSVLRRLRLPPIRVLAPGNDPVRLEAGRQVVLALRRAGATANLAKVSPSRLGRAVGANGSTPSFDAAIVSTPALASYDPDFLDQLFGSNSRTAPLNYAGYRNPEFDALAGRVAGAPDERARRTAVQAELRRLADDLPAIPLFFSQGTFAYRPAIYDGWTFIKGSGILDKRSFLPGDVSAQDQAPGGNEPKSPASSSSALDIASLLSLAVLAVAVIVGGVAGFVVLRRRSGERR